MRLLWKAQSGGDHRALTSGTPHAERPARVCKPHMDYPVESFTPDEQARLAPHVTNLDRPVFALTNLPETVKGAMFARYSRYQGTLRRMFLDEFADSLPVRSGPALHADDTEGTRAAELYERIFVGYGDDSVAQLGGAHVACEWVSNVLTKVLQRPRLGAYLEQSTRYIAYDGPMDGAGHPARFRYYRDPALGRVYERSMDEIFSTYSDLLPRVRPATARSPPRRWTSSAACFRRPRCRTWGSTRQARPTSSSSCT